MPAGTARRGSAGRAYPTRTALPPGPTGTAVAPQPGSPAHATGAAVTTSRHGGHPCPSRAAYATNAPVAVQPAAMPAGATGPTRSAVAGIKAGSTGPAVADQAGVPAVATRGVCRGARPAGSAVTPQQPTGRTALSGRPIDTIADERSTQQCLGGRVDGREQLLLDGLKRGCIGRLGECIRTVCGAQCLGELPVKLRHLSADRLILDPVRGEHRRDGRRHLVATGGQQPRRTRCRCRVGRGQRRPDLGRIAGRRRQRLWRNRQV